MSLLFGTVGVGEFFAVRIEDRIVLYPDTVVMVLRVTSERENWFK